MHPFSDLLRTDRPPRILGVFAHPDDEVFCMAGSMALASDAGAQGRIVSLTRGEAGQIRDASVATRRTLGAVRAKELVRAAAVMGVGDVVCHDGGDGTLADQPLDALAAMVAEHIEDFSPDLVITFGSDGATGHPDHVTVSRATTEACVWTDPQPVLLHAAFPQSSRRLLDLLVEWLKGLDDRFRGTEQFAAGLMLFADGSSMLGYAADHMDVEFFPAGTFIIEQGEPPGKLYLILSGTVAIVREGNDGSAERIGTAGPGSFVGEDALASGQPRNANVVATTSVTCFVLAPGRSSAAAGRGSGSEVPAFIAGDADHGGAVPDLEVDVAAAVDRKMAALASHRSQYALEPDMFPPSLTTGLLGREHFWRVRLG